MPQKLRPKDYLVTGEGLHFAVVLAGPEDGRIIASLRYLKTRGGVRKFDTPGALDFLKSRYPRYLFFSRRLGAETTAVPLSAISRICRPEQTVTGLLQRSPEDTLLKKARTVLEYFTRNGLDANVLGITGSLMLGFYRPDSDIDLVVYEREAFYTARKLVRQATSDQVFSQLDHATWLETYRRRGCALSFDEYLFHEKRKDNKFLYHGTKADLSFQPENEDSYPPRPPVTKMGIKTLRAKITDDRYIFDYPARYGVDHDDIKVILAYTATYYGQAFRDETVEAKGMIECDADNKKYMVIGTSREAPQEYLKKL